MEARTKIIIAEDEELFSKGMALLLKEDGRFDITHIVKDGYQLLEVLKNDANLPDLVLLDIHMAEEKMDGAKAAAIIKKEYKNIKILVLTKYDEPEYVKTLIRLGVDGYILKKYTHEELIVAIDTVLQPQKRLYFPPDIWEVFIQEEKKPEKQDAVKFTKREIQIIQEVCAGNRTPQIASALFISIDAVEKHRSNIFAKLGIKNVVDLVKYAIYNNMCKPGKN